MAGDSWRECHASRSESRGAIRRPPIGVAPRRRTPRPSRTRSWVGGHGRWLAGTGGGTGRPKTSSPGGTSRHRSIRAHARHRTSRVVYPIDGSFDEVPRVGTTVASRPLETDTSPATRRVRRTDRRATVGAGVIGTGFRQTRRPRALRSEVPGDGRKEHCPVRRGRAGRGPTPAPSSPTGRGFAPVASHGTADTRVAQTPRAGSRGRVRGQVGARIS